MKMLMLELLDSMGVTINTYIYITRFMAWHLVVFERYLLSDIGCHQPAFKVFAFLGCRGGRDQACMIDEYHLLLTIMIEFIVARQCHECAKTRPERKVNLFGRFDPNIDAEYFDPIWVEIIFYT